MTRQAFALSPAQEDFVSRMKNVWDEVGTPERWGDSDCMSIALVSHGRGDVGPIHWIAYIKPDGQRAV